VWNVELPDCDVGRGTYVHDGNTGLVQLFDDFFGRYADGADEQGDLFFDDDINKFGELSLGVVVL
jgi:hypothetical protein